MEEFDQVIGDKQTEIEAIEGDAQKAIEEQEKLKEQALKAAGMTDGEYEKYKEDADKIETQISEKDTEIGAKDDEISDKEATVSSNSNTITALDVQIQVNESSKVSSDKEGADATNADIDSKNANLKAKKSDLEKQNADLEKQINQAKEDKKKLEGEKQKLEEQKTKLLSKSINASQGIGNGIPSTTAVSAIKGGVLQSVSGFDSEISRIKSEAATNIDTKKSEIKELQVQRKDLEAKDENKQLFADNSVNALGQGIVDFALTQMGLNQADGSADLLFRWRDEDDLGSNWFSSSKQVGWCAAFVDYCIMNSDFADQAPDWYKACSDFNANWQVNMYKFAKEADAMIDPKDAKPGDIILFSNESDGVMNHVGIVASNENGQITTIEGNTDGGKVGQHTLSVDDSRIYIAKITK